MKLQNILICSLILHFASTVTTNKTDNYVSIIPLKYKIRLEFFVPNEPVPCAGFWPTPGVFTITAEARNTSNKITLPWKSSEAFDSLKVNVTNLTGNQTILVLNVTKCTDDDDVVCILLEDSFQAGDHLEVAMSDEFSKMRLFTYDECDALTKTKQRKYYGYYRPSESVPFLGHGSESKGPRIPIQLTVGLGGIWNKSHKIIGSFNSVVEIDDSLSNDTRWIHLKETPPVDIENVEFFISEFVNYTVATDRNTKVSVWGPPSVIFQNGTTEDTLSAYANYTVSLASSLLNNYEKILDMKYPLDGFNIMFLDDHPWGRLLGQKYLRQRELKQFASTSAAVRAEAKQYVNDDLSWDLSKQFTPITVDEPLEDGMDLTYYLTDLCRKGVIDEEFYYMTLLKMMEGFLTPEIVRNGVRIYLKSNIWKRATKNEFFYAMEESISRQNATDLFLPKGVRLKDVIGDYHNLTWYHRQVNASLLKKETNQIQLTLGYKNGTNFTHGFERWLPVQVQLALSLENSTEILEETFWFPPNTSAHTITKVGGHTLTNSSKIEWLLVNKNRDGLYSTFYDGQLLPLLVTQLNKNCSVFTPWERYNILVQAGISYYYPDIIGLENLFILTSYFGQETDSHLWHDILSKLRKSRFLYTGNDEGYLEMRKHFVPRMESYLESRGGLEKILKSEKGLDWQLREGCIFLRVPACLRYASENLKKFEFTTEWAEIDWFAPAGADPRNFEYLKEQFLNLTDEPYLRNKYFNALQWTVNDTLYESFLNSVIEKNSEVLLFDYALPVGTPVFPESRLSLLINFAMTKFQEEKISSKVFASVAEYVFRIYRYAGFVANRNLYEDLKLFINANQNKLEQDHYSSLERAITMCDEKVCNPESYWNKNGKKFLLWLKKFNEEGYTFDNHP